MTPWLSWAQESHLCFHLYFQACLLPSPFINIVLTDLSENREYFSSLIYRLPDPYHTAVFMVRIHQSNGEMPKCLIGGHLCATAWACDFVRQLSVEDLKAQNLVG